MLHSWRPSGAQHLPCTSSDALHSPHHPSFRFWWCAHSASTLAVNLSYTHSLNGTAWHAGADSGELVMWPAAACTCAARHKVRPGHQHFAMQCVFVMNWRPCTWPMPRKVCRSASGADRELPHTHALLQEQEDDILDHSSASWIVLWAPA